MTANLFQKAVKLLSDVQQETEKLRSGDVPSVYLLLGLQGEVVQLYAKLGDELSMAFSAKERANLARKVSAAENHLKGRRELGLTVEDSKMEALKAVRHEYERELEQMELWERIKILRESLDKAFAYIQQVVSVLKRSEDRSFSESS